MSDKVSLEFTNETKLTLLKHKQALEVLEGLRTLPNRGGMSGEAMIMINHLGKLFIYLRWLLDRALETDRLERETLLTINEIEEKISDAVTKVEGYGRAR